MDRVRVATSAKGFVRFFEAAKRLRFVVTLMALCGALVVAGCGPTRDGATLSTLNKKIGGPGSRSRIVVIRDKDITVFDVGWKVYLDGAVMGDLKTGTFVYRDARSGPHKLMFSRPGDFSRASIQDLVAAPGRTYVYRLQMNRKGQLVLQSSAAAGLAGLLISSAIADAADKRGFFDFTLLEGDEATKALEDIHLSN